jgi:hypothetical protein
MTDENMTQDVDETQEAPAAVPTTPAKKKSHMLSVNISKAREGTYDKLVALMGERGWRQTDAVWAALDAFVENPPAMIQSAGPATSSAQGIWVVHDLVRDAAGSLEGISATYVVDCKRNQIDGSLFIRYAAGNEAERNRAIKKAMTQAEYDAKISGAEFHEDLMCIEEGTGNIVPMTEDVE